MGRSEFVAAEQRLYFLLKGRKSTNMTGAECLNMETHARIDSISSAFPSEHPQRGQLEAGGSASSDFLPEVFAKLYTFEPLMSPVCAGFSRCCATGVKRASSFCITARKAQRCDCEIQKGQILLDKDHHQFYILPLCRKTVQLKPSVLGLSNSSK